MKIAIICLGKRVQRIDIPWITPENWSEISKTANEEIEKNNEFQTIWKKVGNEYRIYIEKRKKVE